MPASLNDLIFDNELYKNILSSGKIYLLIDCVEEGQKIIMVVCPALLAFVQIFLKAALGLKVEYGKGIELGNMVRAAFL